jgi:hypothetical protein
MFRKPSAETIARRAAERAAERRALQAEQVEGLRALAELNGLDSMWAELLTEALARQEVAA